MAIKSNDPNKCKDCIKSNDIHFYVEVSICVQQDSRQEPRRVVCPTALLPDTHIEGVSFWRILSHVLQLSRVHLPLFVPQWLPVNVLFFLVRSPNNGQSQNKAGSFSRVLSFSYKIQPAVLGMDGFDSFSCTQNHLKKPLHERNEREFLIPVEIQESRVHVCILESSQSGWETCLLPKNSKKEAGVGSRSSHFAASHWVHLAFSPLLRFF